MLTFKGQKRPLKNGGNRRDWSPPNNLTEFGQTVGEAKQKTHSERLDSERLEYPERAKDWF